MTCICLLLWHTSTTPHKPLTVDSMFFFILSSMLQLSCSFFSSSAIRAAWWHTRIRDSETKPPKTIPNTPPSLWSFWLYKRLTERSNTVLFGSDWHQWWPSWLSLRCCGSLESPRPLPRPAKTDPAPASSSGSADLHSDTQEAAHRSLSHTAALLIHGSLIKCGNSWNSTS